MFLAHESEIPDPGDYVVRRVLADSFIVARDEAGVVRVMFNMCLHRGMQVCRAEMGNASHFRCPYHAWTYRNDGRLAGLPFHEEAYGGEDGFARAGQSLLPAPWRIQVDVLNGAGDINYTRQIASRIQALAYRIGRVTRAPRFGQTHTVVYFEPGGDGIAARLARQLGVTTSPLPGGKNPRRLVVIVGPHRGPD